MRPEREPGPLRTLISGRCILAVCDSFAGFRCDFGGNGAPPLGAQPICFNCVLVCTNQAYFGQYVLAHGF